MMRWMVSLALFASLFWTENSAHANDRELALKFSPILILTEEAGGRWGDIRVTKPEPVEIMSAESADSLRFQVTEIAISPVEAARASIDSSVDWTWFDNITPPLPFPGIDFSNNRFAFLLNTYTHRAEEHLVDSSVDSSIYVADPHFDYPGDNPTEWNATYFGSGPKSGENSEFGNTAYVHIFDIVDDRWLGNVT